jgi:hypothetical protein
MAVDQAKLDRFLERSVADAAAVWSVSLMVLGKDLGLYDAMAKAGPVTAQELAEATGTDARATNRSASTTHAGESVNR